ncbi:helix-turn-helix transcriptional regulator [Sphingomonas suaedae]|uniref:Helix-turn-helix transcriptional regulator n=1 Tax=Sphingomonas suaedae TaxID=2599297 RepID=A0A518REB1_9SPHN|nr:helix-turn-helix transcriptional regulator [Sphingomonas suaedae]
MDAPVKLHTGTAPDGAVPVDPWRNFVFPNRIRELRRKAGLHRLIALSHRLPDLTYIRLSKIERGEVFARARELADIAAALDVVPDALLIDVDAPAFSIEDWAAPFVGVPLPDRARDRFAVLLAAAVRNLRASDRALTIQAITDQHGIAPVNLSRLENAQRSFEDWNAPTRAAICALLGTANEAALRARIDQLHRNGDLDPWFNAISDPEERLRRTREKIAALRSELADPGPAHGAGVATLPVAAPNIGTIAVLGIAGPDGLILDQDTGERIAPPPGCGRRVVALRLCRATLGAALPGQSILFVDLDRYPVAGGLAVLREPDGYRALSIAIGNDGLLVGHSQHPPRSFALSDVPEDHIHAVIAARFM